MNESYVKGYSESTLQKSIVRYKKMDNNRL